MNFDLNLARNRHNSRQPSVVKRSSEQQEVKCLQPAHMEHDVTTNPKTIITYKGSKRNFRLVL